MMIRAHMRGIAEVDLSLFPLRQSFDPREFLLEPLLHQSFVPFQRTMQSLLASDAELSQKPPDRDQAQQDIEFIFDQRPLPSRASTTQMRTGVAAGSFASPCRKSTSASCHRVSSDPQTAAWPSMRPSHHVDTVPASHRSSND